MHRWTTTTTALAPEKPSPLNPHMHLRVKDFVEWMERGEQRDNLVANVSS